MKGPDALTCPRIERLNIPWRITAVYPIVWHPASEDDQVIPDHWGRGICVMKLIDFPDQSFSEVNLPAYTERFDWLPCGRIQCDQVPATIDENSPLIPVAPHRDPAVTEAAVPRQLSPAIRTRVVAPVLFSSACIKSDNTTIRCTHIHSVIDDDRGGFEASRSDTLASECQARARYRLLVCIPAPGDL